MEKQRLSRGGVRSAFGCSSGERRRLGQRQKERGGGVGLSQRGDGREDFLLCLISSQGLDGKEGGRANKNR